MRLPVQQIRKLLRLVERTRDREIDCQECLRRVAEFSDSTLKDRPVTERLEAVRHHLSVCAECREEFEALERAMAEAGTEARSKTD